MHGTLLLEGRTPGQTGFLFDTGEARKLLHTADAISHEFVSVRRPDWRFAFDIDPLAAAATRHRLTGLLANTGWLAFTPHFHWPAVGRIAMGNDGAQWLPGIG